MHTSATCLLPLHPTLGAQHPTLRQWGDCTQSCPCSYSRGFWCCELGCPLLQGRGGSALGGLHAPHCTPSELGVCGPHPHLCSRARERQREDDASGRSQSWLLLGGTGLLGQCHVIPPWHGKEVFPSSGLRPALPPSSPPYSNMWTCLWYFLSLRGISASESPPHSRTSSR